MEHPNAWVVLRRLVVLGTLLDSALEAASCGALINPPPPDGAFYRGADPCF